MKEILDEEKSAPGRGRLSSFLRLGLRIYAGLLTLLLFLLFIFVDIKDQPTPLEADNVEEIHESYARLAGVCISVGSCGNDQIVIGLEKNPVSEAVYDLLLWKNGLQGE